MNLNGSTRTVVLLIDGKIRELTAELDELKAARRELTGNQRAVVNTAGLKAPRPGARAGGSRDAKAHATKQNNSRTPNDRDRMKALATWAGSAEFDIQAACKGLKFKSAKNLSPWISKCVHQDRLVRIERGIYRVGKAANK